MGRRWDDIYEKLEAVPLYANAMSQVTINMSIEAGARRRVAR